MGVWLTPFYHRSLPRLLLLVCSEAASPSGPSRRTSGTVEGDCRLPLGRRPPRLRHPGLTQRPEVLHRLLPALRRGDDPAGDRSNYRGLYQAKALSMAATFRLSTWGRTWSSNPLIGL